MSSSAGVNISDAVDRNLLPGKSLDSLESDSYYDNQCSCKNKKNGLYCFKSDDKQAGAELYQPQNQLD